MLWMTVGLGAQAASNKYVAHRERWSKTRLAADSEPRHRPVPVSIMCRSLFSLSWRQWGLHHRRQMRLYSNVYCPLPTVAALVSWSCLWRQPVLRIFVMLKHAFATARARQNASLITTNIIS